MSHEEDYKLLRGLAVCSHCRSEYCNFLILVRQGYLEVYTIFSVSLLPSYRGTKSYVRLFSVMSYIYNNVKVCLSVMFCLFVCAARSPVYSHFSITLQGLSTIRTLGKQPVTCHLFHNYQNEHTQVGRVSGNGAHSVLYHTQAIMVGSL